MYYVGLTIPFNAFNIYGYHSVQTHIRDVCDELFSDSIAIEKAFLEANHS